MEWIDEGIVIAVRPHGETSAIAEVFTRGHGRASGLVRGGRSRQMRPVLQIGNHVEATWKARLSEHLGNFRLELQRGYAASAMNDAARLAALSSICTLLRHLPERDAHANLFEITMFVLSFLDDDKVWPGLVVRWELALLEELGFGLDLSECAATGSNDQLIYVSPKTGRAVSASAGEPYKTILLPLPGFLTKGPPSDLRPGDVEAGFRLVGFFLEKYVLLPKGERLPDVRRRMIELVCRLSNADLGLQE
ncbi:MAG: DNA repair protein RecO [Alphaproteobacteria bacterium BRH_c36]|nr:MAG: DNA repair protein RecO [Alphaproteobacteria bacterium BRH_c36]